LDELRIYDRVLTQEQIQANYNGGVSRYNTTVNDETSVGENWTVAATPNDAIRDGTTVVSDTVTIRNISIGSNCGGTTNVTDASAKTLEFHDTTGRPVVIWDGGGNVSIAGNFTSGPVQATAGFVLDNTTGGTIASINDTGTMQIRGDLSRNQGTTCTEPSEGFIVRNETGSCVGYINQSGDMWTKGDVCYNANIG
jgi:hypothetical protein